MSNETSGRVKINGWRPAGGLAGIVCRNLARQAQNFMVRAYFDRLNADERYWR